MNSEVTVQIESKASKLTGWYFTVQMDNGNSKQPNTFFLEKEVKMFCNVQNPGDVSLTEGKAEGKNPLTSRK